MPYKSILIVHFLRTETDEEETEIETNRKIVVLLLSLIDGVMCFLSLSVGDRRRQRQTGTREPRDAAAAFLRRQKMDGTWRRRRTGERPWSCCCCCYWGSRATPHSSGICHRRRNQSREDNEDIEWPFVLVYIRRRHGQRPCCYYCCCCWRAVWHLIPEEDDDTMIHDLAAVAVAVTVGATMTIDCIDPIVHTVA